MEGFLLPLPVRRSAIVEIAPAAGRFEVEEKTPGDLLGRTWRFEMSMYSSGVRSIRFDLLFHGEHTQVVR